MNTALTLTATVLSLAVFSLFASNIMAGDAAKETPDLVYTCKCGKGCDCNDISFEKGKCPCGKKLGKYSIFKIEGDVAIVCACGGGCECDYNESEGTCSCGLGVKKVKLNEQ